MSGSRKILLPRFDSLGDLILLEGFLEAVLQELPEVQPTILVARKNEQLRPLFPVDVDWITVDLNPYTDRPGVEAASEVLKVIGGQWDSIWFTAFAETWLDTLVSYRFPSLPQWHLGATQRPSPLLARVLRVLELEQDRAQLKNVDVPEDAHELEKIQLFWESIGETGTALKPPKLQVPDPMSRWARTFLGEMEWERGDFVVCVPGGTANVAYKLWPAAKYAETIAWLKRNHGLDTLLAGHGAEVGVLETVREACAKAGVHPKLWIGRDGDLVRLASLLVQSRCYFGNDTGPMHLASALEVPVAAVFGGGTWPRFIPFGRSAAAVREMSCFGCGWNCCFGDGPCIAEVPVQTVQEALAAVLEPDSTRADCIVFRAASYPPEVEALIRKSSALHRELETIRLSQIEQLEVDYHDSEEDRMARLKVIDDQGQKIAQMDAEIAFLNTTIRKLETAAQSQEEGPRERRP